MQLKWTHAFQFAGYYAALEKGYYKEAGLSVNIVEATPGVDPVQNVIKGRAQYGVGTSSLLLERQAGKPVVALAVIFQHSPYVLIARQDTPAQGIHDLVGKRVMLEPQSEELVAYLKDEGIPLNRIKQVEHSYDPQDLIDGHVDAIAGYFTNQPYYLDRAHLAYQIYTPRSAGIDFYGDNLFTSEQELRDHPARVKAFRAASLRGWHYAMSHQEEIVDLILAKYSKRHTRDYFLFEARQMVPLLVTDLIEVGYMNPGRWRHIADTYADIGMMKPGFALAGFLYDPNPPPPDLRWLYITLGMASLVLAVVSATTIYIYRINARLRQEAAVRIQTEAALQQEQSFSKAVLDSIPGIFYLYTYPEMKMVMWNKQHETIFGFEHDEMKDRHVLQWHAPEMHESLIEIIKKSENVGQAQFETRLLTKDGRQIPFLLNGARLVRDGKPYLIGVGSDISDRIQVEQALRESEQILSQAQQVSRVGHFATDIKTGVWTSSPVLDEIFGIDDSFTRDIEHWGTILAPEYRQRLLDYYDQVIQDKSRFDMDYKVIRPSDGQVRWVWARGEFDYDDAGNPVRQIGTIQDITQRKQAEEELMNSRLELKVLYDHAPVLLCVLDDERIVQYANPAFTSFVGSCEEELKGGRACGVFGCINALEDPRGCGFGLGCPNCALRIAIEDTLKTGAGHQNIEHHTKLVHNGSLRDVVLLGATALIPSDTQTRVLLCLLDITELKRAEEEKDKLEVQLQHALKLESVGRLAGGVAHDFNNMLGVIIGHAQLALDQVDVEQPIYDDLTEIHKAAEHSADLTRQLLAFARKQTVIPVVLDLNKTIANMLKMLERLIGENAHLVWNPNPELWLVKMDPSQITQMLVNLCVNARDAIVDIGQITIEPGNISIDETFCADHPDALPGDYVWISVTDSGTGMNQQTLDRIFEPFFTTKGVGEGTGLGLATVYGAVRQNDGFIEAHSELGKGTTFTIYLPRYEGDIHPSPEGDVMATIKRGEHTILLVEDEPALLRMTKSMLERMGYTVYAASSPSDAVQWAESHEKQVHLLLTDVLMPEMNGWALAENLLEHYPQLKILLMSGYPADAIMHHGMNVKGVFFIPKPYSISELAAKVREALGDEEGTQ